MDKIWQKRENETAKAFRVFQIYRDLPPYERSIDRVRKILGKPSGYQRYLEEWSSKNKWVTRAGAWDAYRDKENESRRIKQWQERKKQVGTLAGGFVAKLTEKLMSMSAGEISAASMSRWLTDIWKIYKELELVERENDDFRRTEGEIKTVDINAIQEALDEIADEPEDS